MHELSIAESVIDAVTARTGTANVKTLRLEIGQLSGVVSGALRFCFELAAEDTPLAGAMLEISEPVGEAHCRTCDRDFGVSDLVLLCSCGSADVAVTSGQELRILSAEVC
ncbi:MAG: hydrogenase maturation nickel metallochaperone HypA [Mycobacteriales bacterium]|nr:MAG: hydrogenase nickel incorporation protein HypA [Pseudonocardiales bacterium]